jgi:hypothetical protein
MKVSVTGNILTVVSFTPRSRPWERNTWPGVQQPACLLTSGMAGNLLLAVVKQAQVGS